MFPVKELRGIGSGFSVHGLMRNVEHLIQTTNMVSIVVVAASMVCQRLCFRPLIVRMNNPYCSRMFPHTSRPSGVGIDLHPGTMRRAFLRRGIIIRRLAIIYPYLLASPPSPSWQPTPTAPSSSSTSSTSAPSRGSPSTTRRNTTASHSRRRSRRDRRGQTLPSGRSFQAGVTCIHERCIACIATTLSFR